MLSTTTTTIVFGIIAIAVVAISVFIWKRSKITKEVSNDYNKPIEQSDIPLDTGLEEKIIAPQATPMVFAVNDSGYLDLTDMSGKALDNTWGPNPKIYINLLDLASNDVTRNDENGAIIFTSNVGPTKSYIIAEQRYIINYTRL